MKHLLNIRGVKSKMKDKPKAQRLYHFMYGIEDALTISQIKEFKSILDKQHKEISKYVDQAIKEVTKKEKDANHSN